MSGISLLDDRCSRDTGHLPRVHRMTGIRPKATFGVRATESGETLIALGRRHLKLNLSAEESPTRSARRSPDVHGELKVLLVWLST
jgi:hypothetical protein